MKKQRSNALWQLLVLVALAAAVALQSLVLFASAAYKP